LLLNQKISKKIPPPTSALFPLSTLRRRFRGQALGKRGFPKSSHTGDKQKALRNKHPEFQGTNLQGAWGKKKGEGLILIGKVFRIKKKKTYSPIGVPSSALCRKKIPPRREKRRNRRDRHPWGRKKYPWGEFQKKTTAVVK